MSSNDQNRFANMGLSNQSEFSEPRLTTDSEKELYKLMLIFFQDPNVIKIVNTKKLPIISPDGSLNFEK